MKTAANGSGYTVRTLNFAVKVGPGRRTSCNIVGDLYLPRHASPARRVPAVMTTNGFSGSKDDQTNTGTYFASQGYAVLSYSGLGFGGSSCRITLDDPAYDGVAAQQLISYLGGADGIAFEDAAHTRPAAPLQAIKRDRRAHDGRHRVHDPRVGMIGYSYGGAVQLATASVDPRLDTIVPSITWNDLRYALAPNNVTGTPRTAASTPGPIKLSWDTFLTAAGLIDNPSQEPSRVLGCPNFAPWVCGVLTDGLTHGYFSAASRRELLQRSPVHYLSKVRIPTLLVQGQQDTLFNLDEAVETYRTLRRQGTYAAMIWQSNGHSHLTPAHGEGYYNGEWNPSTQHVSKRVKDWFDHWLKDSRYGVGPRFDYYRDWIGYQGSATKAYGNANTYPLPTKRTLHLSGDGVLVTRGRDRVAGTQSFTTTGRAPLNVDPLDVIGMAGVSTPTESIDAPGSFAVWTTSSLDAPLDVVGSPTVHLKVGAPTVPAGASSGPARQLVLFVKVLDVAPNGVASMINGTIAPVRVPDVTKPFTLQVPGFVHRFAPGHRLRLVVAGSSSNYLGGVVPAPVSIASSPTTTLTLPIEVGASTRR